MSDCDHKWHKSSFGDTYTCEECEADVSEDIYNYIDRKLARIEELQAELKAQKPMRGAVDRINELKAEKFQLREELEAEQERFNFAFHHTHEQSKYVTKKLEAEKAQLQQVIAAIQLKLREYTETEDPIAVSYAAQLSRVIKEAEA